MVKISFKELFEQCSSIMHMLRASASIDDELPLWALKKQATRGDHKPSSAASEETYAKLEDLNSDDPLEIWKVLKGKHKINSAGIRKVGSTFWAQLKGMSKADAMKKYVNLAEATIKRIKELAAIKGQLSLVKKYIPVKDRAELWALYKQATCGEYPKGGYKDSKHYFKELKRKQWKKLKDMDNQKAREKFLKDARDVLKKYKVMVQAGILLDRLKTTGGAKEITSLYGLFLQLRYEDYKKDKLKGDSIDYEDEWIDAWKDNEDSKEEELLEKLEKSVFKLKKKYAKELNSRNIGDLLSREVKMKISEAEIKWRFAALPAGGDEEKELFANYYQAKYGDYATELDSRLYKATPEKVQAWKDLKGTSRLKAAAKFLLDATIVYSKYPSTMTRDANIRDLSPTWSREFQLCAYFARNFAVMPLMEECATLKAMYKQVTVGDWGQKSQEYTDPLNKYMVSKWQLYKGMPPNEAARQYIDLTYDAVAKYGVIFNVDGEYGIPMVLKQLFKKSQETVKNLKYELSLTEMSALQAHYFQAKYGAYKNDHVVVEVVKGKDEQKAIIKKWKDLKDMRKETAMTHYNRLVSTYKAKYGVTYKSFKEEEICNVEESMKDSLAEAMETFSKYKNCLTASQRARLIALAHQASAGDYSEKTSTTEKSASSISSSSTTKKTGGETSVSSEKKSSSSKTSTTSGSKETAEKKEHKRTSSSVSDTSTASTGTTASEATTTSESSKSETKSASTAEEEKAKKEATTSKTETTEKASKSAKTGAKKEHKREASIASKASTTSEESTASEASTTTTKSSETSKSDTISASAATKETKTAGSTSDETSKSKKKSISAEKKETKQTASSSDETSKSEAKSEAAAKKETSKAASISAEIKQSEKKTKSAAKKETKQTASSSDETSESKKKSISAAKKETKDTASSSDETSKSEKSISVVKKETKDTASSSDETSKSEKKSESAAKKETKDTASSSDETSKSEIKSTSTAKKETKETAASSDETSKSETKSTSAAKKEDKTTTEKEQKEETSETTTTTEAKSETKSKSAATKGESKAASISTEKSEKKSKSAAKKETKDTALSSDEISKSEIKSTSTAKKETKETASSSDETSKSETKSTSAAKKEDKTTTEKEQKEETSETTTTTEAKSETKSKSAATKGESKAASISTEKSKTEKTSSEAAESSLISQDDSASTTSSIRSSGSYVYCFDRKLLDTKIREEWKKLQGISSSDAARMFAEQVRGVETTSITSMITSAVYEGKINSVVSDKLVLITGISNSLGISIAKIALSHRATVLAVSSQSSDLKALSDAVEAANSNWKKRLLTQKVDFSDSSSVKQLLKFIKSRDEELVHVISADGASIKGGSIEKTSISDLNKVLNTYVVHSFALARFCLPLLKNTVGASFTVVCHSLGDIERADAKTCETNKSSVAIIVQALLKALVHAAHCEFKSTKVAVNLVQLGIDLIETEEEITIGGTKEQVSSSEAGKSVINAMGSFRGKTTKLSSKEDVQAASSSSSQASSEETSESGSSSGQTSESKSVRSSSVSSEKRSETTSTISSAGKSESTSGKSSELTSAKSMSSSSKTSDGAVTKSSSQSSGKKSSISSKTSEGAVTKSSSQSSAEESSSSNKTSEGAVTKSSSQSSSSSSKTSEGESAEGSSTSSKSSGSTKEEGSSKGSDE